MTGREIESAVLAGEIVPRPLPAGWTEIDLGMSNFDHTIDDGFEEALRAGGVFGRHAAWDFNGKVWFSGGVFVEEVWRYRMPVATVVAPTLAELMAAVNNKWGHE